MTLEVGKLGNWSPLKQEVGIMPVGGDAEVVSAL